MERSLSPVDMAKRAAADAALAHVSSGMRIGLGTGSTARWFVEALGKAVRAGQLTDILGVPTSVATGTQAERAKVPLTTLDEAGWLDLTVDGADEADAQLSLIKGGGGALLQEKIVACASDRMIVIADATKKVETLGAFALPIEVVPYGWQVTQAIVERVLEDCDVDGRETRLRLHRDEPFVTDGRHLILDLHLGRIGNPARLAAQLTAIPGVIETGLFVDIADTLILGYEDGRTTTLTKPSA
jgi:ribose 5-phosphate isomerase A